MATILRLICANSFDIDVQGHHFLNSDVQFCTGNVDKQRVMAFIAK